LSPGQADAARAVARVTPLELIVGPAGSGKTTALAPPIDYLQQQGQTVFGVAPTAAAAEVLGTETSMAADTLDKLLYEHSRPDRPPEPRYELPPGATVILDEAGTVATPKLAVLARLADQHQWRVVMVGDPRQFSAIGRGGMFAHLVDICGATELDQLHRFTHPWERDATRRLRQGDPSVIGEYERRGRLHHGTPDEMEAAVIDAWAAARRRGESVALMANTNHTVDRLNHLAQQRRIEADEIRPQGPALDVRGQRLLVGDEVVTRRNQRNLRTDRGAMVKNRDHWTIEQIHPNGTVTITGRSGTVRVPADYAAQYLELGYAQTSHATQGRTVDTALLLVDGPTDTRGLYTPMTRGRHTNHAFIATTENQTAADVLTLAISRDWIDQPAITRQTTLQAVLEADGRLVPARGRSDPNSPRQMGVDLPDDPYAIDDPSWGADQAWQSIRQSIEAAHRRRTAERSLGRDDRGIGR
jgi:ATP-dependent exoDNAse (exonuclease V) alpha subunit